MENLEHGELGLLCTEYKASLSIQTPEGIKSNTPAEQVFSIFSTTKATGINLRLLDTVSSTLVGLGLFGTFLGLMIGVAGFNSTDSQGIQNSIRVLLSGMSTAFMTSLLGMGCSLVYTFFDKTWRNGLHHHLYDLNQQLDALYYIDDVSLIMMRHRDLQGVIEKIREGLTYQDDSGNMVILGNAIRELLGESQEQTRALKTFSTDLADRINDGFDNVISNQMQEKILPLMTNIDETTKVVISHIDKMADKVTAPAADIIESMVEELKGGMLGAVGEFKSSISQSARDELENVITQLAAAAKSMDKLPSDIDAMSSTLHQTTQEVKEVVDRLSAGVQTSMGAIMDDITNRQNNLMASHDASVDELRKLLETFSQSIDRQASLNESVNQTMEDFEQTQDDITRSMLSLRAIADDMKTATGLFSYAQTQNNDMLSKIQLETQQNIDSLREIMSQSGQLSKENAEKFDIIRQGLSQIFTQLQGGLTKYSETVQISTQKYLDQYSTSLSKVAENLNSAIQMQNENIEVLAETLQDTKNKL